MRHRVKLLARRQNLLGPQRVVPSAALQPLAGRRSFGGVLNAVKHLLQRFAAREIDRELKAAGIAEMRVRIVEAGHHERVVQIDETRLRPFGLEQILIGAGGGDDSVAHGNCTHEIKLALAEPDAGQDVAVIVDGVRRGGLSSERHRGGKKSSGGKQAAHSSEYRGRTVQARCSTRASLPYS